MATKIQKICFFISFCRPSLLHTVHLKILSRTNLAIKLTPHRSLSGIIHKNTSKHLNCIYDTDMIEKSTCCYFLKRSPKYFKGYQYMLTL